MMSLGKVIAVCALGLLTSLPALSGNQTCVDYWPVAASVETSEGTATSITVPPDTVLGATGNPPLPHIPMPFFLTLRDASGNIKSYDGVCLTTSCGNFLNGTALVPSEAFLNFISYVPPSPLYAWRAPSTPGTCVIRAFTEHTFAEWTVNVAEPEPPPPDPPDPPASPVTEVSGQSPSGAALKLSLDSVGTATCTLAFADFIDPAVRPTPSAPPSAIAQPYGAIDFRVDNCGVAQSVTFVVEVPEPLPPTAQWWKYGPTPDNRSNHWYVIPSTVSGKRISFTITDSGLGDDDLTLNGSISDLGMVAIPGGTMQDLWWSGLAENGWGMTLVQHRDVLFANMFVYDATGAPTWYVMPSGSWDTAHKVYTGDLYLPKSSPFYAYDVSKFDIGPSVGTARITFNGVNEAVFEYTINGISARKNISRIPFGPVALPLDKPLGDLWWAGLAQNGWGLVLSQQYATLFGLWFTYDASGKATWFVMPNVEFVSKDTYRGNIYRPEGPPWLGVTYDPSRHRTVQVGTFTLQFSGEGATFNYTIDGKSGSIPISRIPF